MQSNARAHHLLLGLILTACGCHSPYGYQSPYGQGYYGQPPGGPVYTIPPGQTPGGGTYVPGLSPPGISQPQLGQPSQTPTLNPGSTPGSTPPTYDNSGGIKFESPNPQNSAPTFNTNPPASQPDGTTLNRKVPDPTDDTNGLPSANKSPLTPTSSTQINDRNQPFPVSPNDGSQISPVRVEGGSQQPEEISFEEPLQKTSAVQQTSAVQRANLQVASDPNSPYGRDTAHANPQWLRGVVDYDQADGTWQIIYTEFPDQRDVNGGSLTLGNHPDLAKCQNGDVVLVKGGINSAQTDARGKPLYVLDSVKKLSQ